MSSIRPLPRPSLALVVALLALVVALGGTSYAAVSLAKNSVVSKTIKNGEVKTADLKSGAVTGDKVKDGSLAAGDFAAGVLPTGAVGPAGPAGAKGATGAAGATGPQGVPGPVDTVTIIKSSANITPNNFASVTVLCPAGMTALGGGPDLSNVLTMAVTASGPVSEATRPLSQTDGQHPGPTGWFAAARNDSASDKYFKVGVVCAA